MKLVVNVVGICNSRKMMINENGINLSQWEQKLSDAKNADIQQFINEIIERNLRNSIFVDITASDLVANVYEQLLRKSISVVACNKVAASSAYDNYKKLKDIAREFNCPFSF
jgi:aspartokinase/homoserine dehydrogenase 1